MPCNPCVRYQAPVAAFFRPGQWIPYIRNAHRSVRKWKFQFPKTEEHLIIIREALEQSQLIIYQQKTTMYGFLLRAYAFTGLCGMYVLCGAQGQTQRTLVAGSGWMDVVTLEVYLDDNNSSEVSVKAIAGSTGFLPLILPLSPLLNCLLCWVPFWDQGNNQKYLQKIWKSIHNQI